MGKMWTQGGEKVLFFVRRGKGELGGNNLKQKLDIFRDGVKKVARACKG
jgi:hypothetical protein